MLRFLSQAIFLICSLHACIGFAADATTELRKKAESGNTAAQFSLGAMYSTGQDVPKDSVEAVKWYRKAAEQGEVHAQYNLGAMYATGEGVTKDMTQAVQWYRKAAEQGDAKARFMLGAALAVGEGVPEDGGEAIKWFRRAAEQGQANAQRFLGSAYARGQDVPKDSVEAANWYRKAAEQGEADAQCFLGSAYALGDGVPKNNVEALKWYIKAAEQGQAAAQNELGRMYVRGDGVAKDPAEATKWFRKAAIQGNGEAQTSFGLMYLIGEGVTKDEIEALAWINIGVGAGDTKGEGVRNMLEHQLGRDATLIAQQRSKELLKEIEIAKSKPHTDSFSSPYFVMTTDTPKATGSGSIVSADGYVLTAAHVISDANRISVFTAKGEYSAMVVRVDVANDVAVLKLDSGTYDALPVASSRQVRLGQPVATIGFPNVGFQGFSPKVTRGEISSLNGFADDPRSWQISVPVQPGNSGGPLLDESGNLIGIVVAKLGFKASALIGDVPQNVNYAVKSAYALALLEPYLDANSPQPIPYDRNFGFEDMVARAQKSVVLIFVY